MLININRFHDIAQTFPCKQCSSISDWNHPMFSMAGCSTHSLVTVVDTHDPPAKSPPSSPHHHHPPPPHSYEKASRSHISSHFSKWSHQKYPTDISTGSQPRFPTSAASTSMLAKRSPFCCACRRWCLRRGLWGSGGASRGRGGRGGGGWGCRLLLCRCLLRRWGVLE